MHFSFVSRYIFSNGTRSKESSWCMQAQGIPFIPDEGNKKKKSI